MTWIIMVDDRNQQIFTVEKVKFEDLYNFKLNYGSKRWIDSLSTNWFIVAPPTKIVINCFCLHRRGCWIRVGWRRGVEMSLNYVVFQVIRNRFCFEIDVLSAISLCVFQGSSRCCFLMLRMAPLHFHTLARPWGECLVQPYLISLQHAYLLSFQRTDRTPICRCVNARVRVTLPAVIETVAASSGITAGHSLTETEPALQDSLNFRSHRYSAKNKQTNRLEQQHWASFHTDYFMS